MKKIKIKKKRKKKRKMNKKGKTDEKNKTYRDDEELNELPYNGFDSS